MSSISSILSAGGPGTPAVSQIQAPEPSGVAFEMFLQAAQDRAEYPPSAASGASTTSEAQEGAAAIGQIGLQNGIRVALRSEQGGREVTAIGQIDSQDKILESGLGDLPSNGPQDLSPRLLPSPEGLLDDDLTAWGDDPVRGLSLTPNATPMQKAAGPDAQDGKYASEPLAALLSPAGPDDAAGLEGRPAGEGDQPGDAILIAPPNLRVSGRPAGEGDGDQPSDRTGRAEASSAPETDLPRMTSAFKDGRRASVPGTPFIASSLIPPQVGPPGRWDAAGTVERGRTGEEAGASAEAGTAEMGSSEGPAEEPHPARALLPEDGMGDDRRPVAVGMNRPERVERRNLRPNARRDGPTAPGDLSGKIGRSGLDLVEGAQEAVRPGLTADATLLDGSAEPSSVSEGPARKGVEPLSAGVPPGNTPQDATLLLRMQSPLPAPDSEERVEDSPPEMAGVRMPEARNAPVPFAPVSGMPAFGPALGEEKTSEAGSAGSGRFAESTGLGGGERSGSGVDRSGGSMEGETMEGGTMEGWTTGTGGGERSRESFRGEGTFRTGMGRGERSGSGVGRSGESTGMGGGERSGSGVGRSGESTGMGGGERSGESFRGEGTFRGGGTLEAGIFRRERATKDGTPTSAGSSGVESALTAREAEDPAASPAQATPEKAEKPSGDRPADISVTMQGSPADGRQVRRGSEAGQSIDPAPDEPSEAGISRARPFDTGTDDLPPATTPAKMARVKTPDEETDALPPITPVPRDTHGRTAETGVLSGRREESRFDRQVERPGKPTGRTGIERLERRAGDPSGGSSDQGTASPLTEIAATSERHEGKSDRRDAHEGDRQAAESAIRISPHPSDPAPLKASPEYGPVPSAQRQSAASAAGSAPATAGSQSIYTPETASHPASPAVPNDPTPPEAVVRQVIRGARFLLKDAVSEVHVRLEPPELGSVHIRLVSGGATLSGEIGVSNHDVKGIVESHLHQLRSSLTEQGLHVGQIDVSVRDDQRGGAWPDRTGGFGHPGDMPDGRRSPERNGRPGWETREEDRSPRRSQNLVDYFA